MESIKNQTLRSAKWNTVERFSVQGIQFLLGLIMARILTPDDYGIIGMLSIFFAVSQSFIDSGFSTALIRKANPTEAEYSTVFIFNIVVAIFLYAILFFTAPYIASFFNLEILKFIIRVQAITLIVNSLMVVQVAMLTTKLDFKSLAIRSICSTLISGIVGIILAYKGLGVWALVVQGLILSIVNLVLICWYCKWYPKSHFSVPAFKELGAFGSKLLVSGLIHTIYVKINTLAIGKFYSAKDLGFYSRGQQIAELPNTTINGVLQTVTYPILSRIKDDESHLVAVYRRYIRITSMVIFILCGTLCALGKPLVLFLLTDKWADAVPYLQVFAAACMFDHISTINLNLLKVKGRSDLCLRLEVIKKSIALVLLCCAIPLGVMAICITAFAYNQIAIVLNTYYTGKLFGLTYFMQVGDFVRFLLGTIVACLPTYLITLLGLPNIVTLFIGVAMSFSIYWMLFRDNEDMIEFVDLIESQLKRK